MKKILSINSDENFCSCCGKVNLKRVVWVEDTETGNVDHYGTQCANKILSFKGIAKVSKSVSLAVKLEKYKQWNRMDIIYSYSDAIKKAGLTDYIKLCDRYRQAIFNETEKDFQI